MKKIFLSAAAILALIRINAQTDSSLYHSRKLKAEELNFVSSYYQQDGNNSAVGGGIGSQKLNDFANVIDVKLTGYDKKLRKKTLIAELGIDHYTSASSDRIDTKANSSASYSDTRFYPSVGYSVEDEQRGTRIGVGIASSTEYDYQSFGGNISYDRKTKDKSGEFSAKLQVYLDQVKKIAPVELRNGSDEIEGTAGRNTFAVSLSYAQIINKQLQFSLLTDLVQQRGFLSLPFYRVYFQDGSVHQEELPDSRVKFPLGFRANYFAGDKLIIRTYYRHYTDSWGLHSNTAMIETPIKITPFFSISPFYRFYSQTAAKYFAPYQSHTASNEFYTSNFDMSNFNSSFLGTGVRMAPSNGVLGVQHLSMLEIRYGHYIRNTSFSSNIVSLNIQFK